MEKKAATGKSKFTADERTKLVTLAWLAGATVSECDKAGGDRESAKEADALKTAVTRCFLAYQVRTDENLTGGEPSAFDFEKAETLVFKAAEEVLTILEAKETAANVDHYKTLILEVAYSVALAYGAGWRGRGPKVSDTEKAMIEKLAAALKATPLLEGVRKEADEGKLG